MSKHGKKSAISAEPGEPRMGSAPAPVWLVLLLGAAGYLGFMYVDLNGGGYHEQVYEPYPSLKYVQSLQPKDDGDKALAMGAEVYKGTCALCHQLTGLGVPNQFPPLAGSEWVNAAGPNRIIRIVLNGLGGPVDVKGTKWDAQMPPFGGAFTDEQIAAVVTFIRQNKEWGAGGGAVKPEQVKAIRDATSSRSNPWTAEDLQKVNEAD